MRHLCWNILLHLTKHQRDKYQSGRVFKRLAMFLVSLQEARHGETEERLPAKLHPLSGLHTHDAHRSPLLQVPVGGKQLQRALILLYYIIFPLLPFLLSQCRPDVRLSSRLFLDPRSHRGHHEQGIRPLARCWSPVKDKLLSMCLMTNDQCFEFFLLLIIGFLYNIR